MSFAISRNYKIYTNRKRSLCMSLNIQPNYYQAQKNEMTFKAKVSIPYYLKNKDILSTAKYVAKSSDFSFKEKFNIIKSYMKAIYKQTFKREAQGKAIMEIADFTLADKKTWNQVLNENCSSSTGRTCLEFMSDWANRMENEFKSGRNFNDAKKIVDKQLQNENKYDMTGRMYSWSLATLTDVWKHGEQIKDNVRLLI